LLIILFSYLPISYLSLIYQDELKKERHLHRGISENIILEDFRRDIRDFYTVEEDEILGKGCTGVVRLCTRITTGVKYALKTLRVDNMVEESKKIFHKEINIMSMCDHPNILRLHEYFETDKKVYLILDLCTGGELLDHLNSHQSLDENIVRRYVKQILGAIIYLHERGIVHRDLKLENFLLETKGEIAELKLIDFGLSMFLNKNDMASESVGTPFYVAPEVLTGSYEHKCDVWSLGVITYMMLCGRPPFFGKTDRQILQAVESEPINFSHRRFAHISVTSIDFVASCLERNTYARPSAVALLDHPFFTESSVTNHHHGAAGAESKPSFNVMQKLNYFLRRPLFYKLCLEAVAFSLSTDQIAELRNQFRIFDTDNTGFVSCQDLHLMMAGLNLLYRVEDPSGLPVPPSDDEGDEHRQISYHEFIAATTSLQTVTEENIKVAFDLLAGHNNYIELESVHNIIGSEARGHDSSEILGAVDLPLEGHLGYAEVFNCTVPVKCLC
jgi:calcium-dependent protein kinase